MKNKKANLVKAILSVLISATILSSMTSQACCDSGLAPSWFKPGAYAEYTFQAGYVLTNESQVKIVDNSPSIINYTRYSFDAGTYRWDYVDLNSTTMKLKINVSLTEKGNVTEHDVFVYVDVATRRVFLENGTCLSTTHVWLPSYPSATDDLVVWDLPPDFITLRIEDPERDAYTRTIQGRQQVFSIGGGGMINGKNSIFLGMYDMNTGILLSGHLEHEPTMIAFNYTVVNTGIVNLSSTNIDLGPSSEKLDFKLIIAAVSLPVVFVIVFGVMYSRKKRRRH
jgi:hypothetical protein